jgi:hypothetical protein
MLLGGGLAFAEEQSEPEMEFLEYLGMWEESDEDWLILDAAMTAGKEERSDPVPEGEESMETENEG